MGLETVGQLVAQHTATPIAKKSNRAELEAQLVRKMFDWIMWGMIIIGIGVVMMVANKSFAIGAWLRFLSAVLVIGGVGVATAGVFSAVRQGVGLSGKKSVNEIGGATVDTKSLPTAPMPASLPSVTERTTQLIPADDVRANNVIDSKRRE